ncbi:MAG: cold shock domain-containing protein [Pseudomonadota bacterium]|nr:cold shock domain-containing protein [Pseudomonadota bacterium]
MPTGTVKWFNQGKGYGFIIPEATRPDNNSDVFVHVTALQASGISHLPEGKRVSYELDRRFNGREVAVNIALLGDSGFSSQTRSF